jgi:hypothetical protein
MKMLSCAHLLVIEDPGATQLLVSDPNGRQTGMTHTGEIVENIPGSTYFSADPLAVIFAPEGGSYETEVLGLASGTYTLAVGLEDFLNPPTTQNFSGPIAPGLSVFYATTLDLQTNAIETQLSLGSTFDALGAYVKTLSESGKINNRGVSNSLEQKLANARTQISTMNVAALRGSMISFVNEIMAQKGKHIDVAAADSLSASAQFLLNSINP